MQSNDEDLTSQAAYGRPSRAQAGAAAQSMSAEKYIRKASANDLPTLLSRQENMLALVKKEFNLHDDSPQTQAELSKLLVQNGILLVGQEVLQGAPNAIAEMGVAGSPDSPSPRRNKILAPRGPKLQSLDRLATQHEIEKMSRSPKVKKVRSEYHTKKLSLNLYRMMILLQ